MTNENPLIRFEPTGPAGTGLVEWETIDSATLVEGAPVQRGHIYHEDSAAGYLAGVWDCTPFTQHFGPYGVNEFMLLLEGSLVMGLPDGRKIRLDAGQAFVIPKGLQCQWHQPGYLRKFFMIVDGPDAGPGANPSLTRITTPPLEPLPTTPPKPGADSTESQPITVTRTYFEDSTGRMMVAVRDFAAMQTAATVSQANQLVHVVSGAVTLQTVDGTRGFGKGETFYVRAGAETGWAFEAETRLLVAAYTPAS